MEVRARRPKDREGTLSKLNAAIEVVNLAEKISSITPAKAAFASVGLLLTMVKVCLLLFWNELLQAHTYPGLDGQRAGIRQTRVGLC